MAERTISLYQRLFEVRLLHHYWLDEGATVFDQIADAARKNARLLGYDVRPLFDVRPTAATERGLSAYRCVYRTTALGLVVGAPASAIFPADTVFTFIVSVKSSRVHDYTSLTLRPQRIHELFNSADDVTYRYKENVAVLSNLTGATRGTGPNTSLFLSREIPAPDAGDQVESLVLSGGALLQLTSDNPGATTQQLNAQATDHPVFVHQADAPDIVPPAGLAGAPARGVRLSADIADDAFAIVSLTAVRADNDAFSFVDAGGAPKANPPVYQVRFKNRSTVWAYLDKSTLALSSTTPNPLPLTFFGNAGTNQKPSGGFVKADVSGSTVTRLISEVYV
jgi:hypothetical protein